MAEKKAHLVDVGRELVHSVTASAILRADRALTKEAATRHSVDVRSGQLSAVAFFDELEKIATATSNGASLEAHEARNPLRFGK